MMRFRAATVTAAALLACVTLGSFHATAVRAQSPEYLPDSMVLARVDDRVIRVYDFCERYFASDPGNRPGADSTGRVSFLKTMVDKEVMSLTLQALNPPLESFDQLTMRQHEVNLLAFYAYQRRVRDPAAVTEKDVRAVYAEQAWELRLRYLLLPDEVTADLVRGQLLRGRITWREAATRYSLGPDSLRDGDLGWRSRGNLPGVPLAQVFKLHPPGISQVTRDNEGFKIWQCVGRRPAQLPPYYAIRRPMLRELRADREAALDAQFMAELSARAKPVYDTTTVAWLADRFRVANKALEGPGRAEAGDIDLRSHIPILDATDTLRVLASVQGRSLTVGRLTTAYRDTPPLQRQRLSTPAALFTMLQRMVLEPAIVQYAREHGVDHDPEYLKEMAKRREGMLLKYLYADSIESNIRVTEATRREYYQAHELSYRTRERVRYALIPRLTEAGADSVIERLKAGEPPESILARDSLSGMTRGVIRELMEGQPHSYTNLLFQELRAGQSAKEFLGGDKVWAVFHIILHDASRKLSYAESRDLVDQGAENSMAEQLLSEFLARQRRLHRIEAHPERLARINLIDPRDDGNIPSGD